MSDLKLCQKHGGDVAISDAYWLCVECTRKDLDLCQCGSHARYFGEAAFCSVRCESCDEHVVHIGMDKNVRALWNSGVRGEVL